MKTKKVPIFLEFMKKSFFIISLILIIYTIGQLIAFWMFTDEYERDLLKSRYNEIINLSQDINVQISESGFYEFLTHLSYEDEYVRIYSPNKIYYASSSEVWEDIKLDYINKNISKKS